MTRIGLPGATGHIAKGLIFTLSQTADITPRTCREEYRSNLLVDEISDAIRAPCEKLRGNMKGNPGDAFAF